MARSTWRRQPGASRRSTTAPTTVPTPTRRRRGSLRTTRRVPDDGALESVLRLVAEGRLTAEEAGPILDALEAQAGGDGPRPSSSPRRPPASPPQSPAPRPPAKAPPGEGRGAG